MLDWRNSSAVKNTCYPSRGPNFSFLQSGQVGHKDISRWSNVLFWPFWVPTQMRQRCPHMHMNKSNTEQTLWFFEFFWFGMVYCSFVIHDISWVLLVLMYNIFIMAKEIFLLIVMSKMSYFIFERNWMTSLSHFCNSVPLCLLTSWCLTPPHFLFEAFNKSPAYLSVIISIYMMITN